MIGIPPKLMAILEEVPERIIRQAAEDLGEGENNFRKLLEKAEAFRYANCIPIYLSTSDWNAFCVTSQETKDIKKLH